MKAITCAVLLGLLLAGCATKEPPSETIKYLFVKVPKELTEKVKLTPPPEPKSYSVMSWDQKEDTLIKLIQERTQEVGTCNTRLDGVDAWSLKQSVIYQEPSVKP
jgi:hypothetical protein